MKSQGSIIIIVTITIVLVLSSIPQEATARILKEGGGDTRWIRNKHLLLPSFYNPVHNPAPDPGTEGRAFSAKTVEQKNFAGQGKKVVVHPPPIPPPPYGRAFIQRASIVSLSVAMAT
ncbi:hypothetical protein RND71_034956 [Anisodus tanguticus]|uniref:Transmembrane protein n=1 Tax=Anisodus tanguticus TaxID=243964 RepID=A0AAE1R3M5_9SOLA|nr:hypothetical protein RND71_034956 [Anisodus tanguticus]